MNVILLITVDSFFANVCAILLAQTNNKYIVKMRIPVVGAHIVDNE